MIAGRIDELIRHMAGFSGNIGQCRQTVVDGIIAGPFHDHRPIHIVPQGELYGAFADFPRFVLVNVRNAPKEGTLQIAESIRTDPADFQFVFDLFRQ